MLRDQPRRSTIVVDGSRTAIFEYGALDSPLVVAVHGFRGTHHGLAPLARALVARGYRVVVPDLPGCGQSTPLDGKHDADGYGAWLVGLVSAIGETGVVLGHSFGSVIVGAALRLGLAPTGVALVNPIAAPPLMSSRRGAAAAARVYYGLARLLPAPIADRLLGSRAIAAISGTIMTTTSDRTLRHWIRAEHRRQADAFAHRTIVLETYRSSTCSTVSQYCAHFRAPTLVVGAGLDDLSSVESQRAFAARLPRGILHILPDAGHLIPYEFPDVVAALVGQWHPVAASAGCGGGHGAERR